jgi:hypothetical protein
MEPRSAIPSIGSKIKGWSFPILVGLPAGRLTATFRSPVHTPTSSRAAMRIGPSITGPLPTVSTTNPRPAPTLITPRPDHRPSHTLPLTSISPSTVASRLRGHRTTNGTIHSMNGRGGAYCTVIHDGEHDHHRDRHREQEHRHDRHGRDRHRDYDDEQRRQCHHFMPASVSPRLPRLSQIRQPGPH